MNPNRGFVFEAKGQSKLQKDYRRIIRAVEQLNSVQNITFNNTFQGIIYENTLPNSIFYPSRNNVHNIFQLEGHIIYTGVNTNNGNQNECEIIDIDPEISQLNNGLNVNLDMEIINYYLPYLYVLKNSQSKKERINNTEYVVYEDKEFKIGLRWDTYSLLAKIPLISEYLKSDDKNFKEIVEETGYDSFMIRLKNCLIKFFMLMKKMIINY
ncbi:hypothetical protein [Facklamia sp. P12950]|uniref:hypothetical protein n=1 Tax=Facklamia sp. P12950 TaxID=3421951 RepID=UPI003D16EFB4